MNIDFTRHTAFSCYVLLLMLAGLLTITLASPAFGRASRGLRMLNLAIGLAMFGYGFYLAFVFGGGHYFVFFYAFVVPVILVVRTVASIAATRRLATAQPMPWLAAPAQVPPTYAVPAYAPVPGSYGESAPAAYVPITYESAPPTTAATSSGPPAPLSYAVSAAPSVPVDRPRHAADDAGDGLAYVPFGVAFADSAATSAPGQNRQAPYSGYYPNSTPRIKRPWAAYLIVGAVIVAIVGGAAFAVYHLNTSQPAAPDQQALAAMNLQAADLPGWTSTPADDSADSDSADPDLSCAALGADPVSVRDAASPKFTLATMTVESSMSTYSSDAVVKHDIARLSNPALTGCLQQAVVAAFANDPSGARASGVNAVYVPAAKGSPAGVVGVMKLSATISVGAASQPFAFDMIFIASHQVEATIDITQVGSPIPADLESSLTSSVAARVTR